MKTPILTRLARLLRLAGWLWTSARAIKRLNGQPLAVQQQTLTNASKHLFDILNIRLNITPAPDNPDIQTALIVANHVSWLDIFAVCTFRPTGFIAKQEVRKWPLIGKLCANIGTVFINRNDRKDIAPVNAAIGNALTHGRSVCFFPEARTSDGLGLLPFKAALFQAAIDTQSPVCVVALRYLNANGERTTQPAYVGNTSLMQSLWRILSMPSLEIRLDWQILTPPYPTDGASRFTLKDRAEKIVSDIVR